MDVNGLTQLIGAVGFPIACSVYLITTTNKKLDLLNEVINQNTMVIQRLYDKLTEYQRVIDKKEKEEDDE